MRRVNSGDQFFAQLIQDNDQLTLPDEIQSDQKHQIFLENAIYYTDKLLKLLIMQINRKTQALQQIVQHTFSKQQLYLKQILKTKSSVEIPEKQQLMDQYEKVKIEFKEKAAQSFSIYSTKEDKQTTLLQEQMTKQDPQIIWSINEEKEEKEASTFSQNDHCQFKIYSDRDQSSVQIHFPKRITQEYQKDLISKLEEITNKYKYQSIVLT